MDGLEQALDVNRDARGLSVGDDQAPTYETAGVDLTPDEEAAFSALVKEIEQADDPFRVEEIRPALERREAHGGRQFVAWDSGERRYVDMVRQLEDEAEPDQDIPTLHVDNFFTPYGLDFQALMTANPIETSFAPGDPDKPADVMTAEEGERFVEWVNKQCDFLTVRRWLSHYFWTDGFGAVYTRMRADKALFGAEFEPEIVEEPGIVDPGGLRCAMCGDVAPHGSTACGYCGASLEGAFPTPPEIGMIPRVARVLEVPKAGIKKTAHGIVECRRTPGAKLVRECGYLELLEDIPRAQAKALYPEKADKIGSRGSESAHDTFETAARRGLSHGNDQRTDHLVTHKRVWLRPWHLEEVAEEVRAELKRKFPDGILLVFMGNELCEAFNESMDDHWVFRFAYTSHGSAVLAAGSSTWELQQTANELLNLRVEGARQGIPALIVNNDVLDPEAFAAGRLQPGLIYQAKTPSDGGTLREAVVPTPVANLPSEVGNLEKELGNERAQHRSGIVAALWGGQSGGAGRTLGGYRLQRDQGLMRHGLPWRELQALGNESDLQAVRLYARDGYYDVEVATRGEAGEWGKDVIAIDSLQGEIRIDSDDDSGFPMGPAERRAAWFEYLANGNLTPILMGPLNEELADENLGIRDLRFPGQEAREAQRREIELLLEGEPSVDPMTGLPVSSIPVDVELEDHDSHILGCDLWANSRAGAKARRSNPSGWANVKAHRFEHLAAKGRKAALEQQVMAMAAQPAMPALPGPAAPAPGPGPAGPPIVRQNPMEAPMGPGEAPAPALGAPVAM